ncbi:MAG: cob(I)yrinic acid a,c-diamide adenosyltransferase [Dehalococcoidia bacterium]
MNVSTNAESRSAPSAPETALVEVFTGDGKGKTSAALGMVLRAVGHGLRVHIVFFMKGEYPYGEQKALTGLRGVSFSRFGSLEFIDPQRIREEDRAEAHKALEAARRAVMSGHYDLVILDEVNLACAWGLVELEAVAGLIQEKPETVELILTGRRAPPRLLELADVVTEMKEVKHPYRKGVLSRRGVDY